MLYSNLTQSNDDMWRHWRCKEDCNNIIETTSLNFTVSDCGRSLHKMNIMKQVKKIAIVIGILWFFGWRGCSVWSRKRITNNINFNHKLFPVEVITRVDFHQRFSHIQLDALSSEKNRSKLLSKFANLRFYKRLNAGKHIFVRKQHFQY